MYNGPSGPVAFLVHIAVRRPIVSVVIAVLGLSATVGYVNRTPGGPGILSGSGSVIRQVEDRLIREHPEYRERFQGYRVAFLAAREQRASREHGRELPDDAINEVLTEFGSGLTPSDVRANAILKESVEEAYFYELIFRHGSVDMATIVYVNKS